MTFRSLFLTMTLTIATALSGCGFNENDSRSDRENEDIREMNRQRDEMSPVLGTWGGTLNPGNGALNEVQLIVEAQEETNLENGRMVTRMVPMARLRSVSTLVYDDSFRGNYYSSSGEFSLTRVEDPNRPKPPFPGFISVRNLKLVFRNGKLTGRASSERGSIGTIDLTLQSSEYTPPPEGEDNLINARLREQYNRFVGTYSSSKYLNPPLRDSFCVDLKIYIQEVPNQLGATTPTLRAFHERSGLARTDLRLIMDGVFDGRQNPPRVEFSGESGTLYKMNVSGRFGVYEDGSVNYDVINAVQISNRGVDGDMTLIRRTDGKNCETPVPAPRPRPRPTPNPSPEEPVDTDLPPVDGAPSERIPRARNPDWNTIPVPDESSVPTPEPRPEP